MTIDATGQPNLFRLYHAVRELGGFVAVTESKFWAKLSQEILGQVSCDLILCKLYVNNLLDWECEFDRGGLDSKSILAQVPLLFSVFYLSLLKITFFVNSWTTRFCLMQKVIQFRWK